MANYSLSHKKHKDFLIEICVMFKKTGIWRSIYVVLSEESLAAIKNWLRHPSNDQDVKAPLTAATQFDFIPSASFVTLTCFPYHLRQWWRRDRFWWQTPLRLAQEEKIAKMVAKSHGYSRWWVKSTTRCLIPQQAREMVEEKYDWIIHFWQNQELANSNF